MSRLLPQEMDVWYLIPAVRKELSNCLQKEHNLKQKDIAKILGVTEAAVSQYKTSKRAKEIEFCTEEKKNIQKTAKNMIENPQNTTKEFYKLTQKLQGCNSLCKLHHQIDDNVEKDCNLCKKKLKE